MARHNNESGKISDPRMQVWTQKLSTKATTDMISQKYTVILDIDTRIEGRAYIVFNEKNIKR